MKSLRPHVCYRIITMILLQVAVAQEILLDSLEDGPGILPFKLGPTKIISHYHSFLQFIDIDDIKSKVSLVKTQLNDVRPQLNNKTLSLYEPHIDYLSKKLEKVSDQLQTFEVNRVKRGLIDGLGSVVKSISGNLDYTDAIRYDNALKSLQSNEEKLVSEFNTHISLSKEWMLEHSTIIKTIAENQDKIKQVLSLIMDSEANRETDLIKYAHLAQLLLILGDNIEDLAEELVKLENLLAFIRASSTHHSMLSLDVLRSMLDKLKSLYNKDEIIDLNLREYYDIIKLGSYYTRNKIVIVFKIPIAFPHTYDLYKLAIVPNKNHNILIPASPYIAIHRNDFMYIETECPKSNTWYLCEIKINYKPHDQVDCIQTLITTQRLDTTCEYTSVHLDKEALEQLDDKHYVIAFPKPTKTQTSCGKNTYTTLQGSYLATVPSGCYLQTSEFTILNSNDRTRGTAIKIMDLPPLEDPSSASSKPLIKLNSINLENLHASNTKISLQHPVEISQSVGSSLYHTTIPMYVVLLSTAALTIGLLFRRSYVKRQRNPHNTQETYAEISENPRDGPSLTPATFSKKILQ
ncbi:hypothetical protein ABMA27_001577 [Loxostege sticticalis]|uniref:Envelope fusion protein n=1 Tax=Loxostege sticticalis TaxID=481309 RepID=A0ABR3HZ10_LOXSC